MPFLFISSFFFGKLSELEADVLTSAKHVTHVPKSNLNRTREHQNYDYFLWLVRASWTERKKSSSSSKNRPTDEVLRLKIHTVQAQNGIPLMRYKASQDSWAGGIRIWRRCVIPFWRRSAARWIRARLEKKKERGKKSEYDKHFEILRVRSMLIGVVMFDLENVMYSHGFVLYFYCCLGVKCYTLPCDFKSFNSCAWNIRDILWVDTDNMVHEW